MSGSWDGGKRVAGAAALAVERFNANQDRLEYSWADSGCSPQQGLVAMGELLRAESTVDAVIGRMQLCVRGDELPVWRAENSSDQLVMHSCFTVKQRKVPPGGAPLFSALRENQSLVVRCDSRYSIKIFD